MRGVARGRITVVLPHKSTRRRRRTCARSIFMA